MASVATPTLVKNSRSTRSTIALKLLMAVSGIVFIGFVLLHMYGNLKAFAGQEAYNDYAHHLRILGEPMLPREGVVHTTKSYALRDFSGAEWESEEKSRHVKELAKDVAEASAHAEGR